VRYINGKATTVEAMTTPTQVNTIWMPNWASHFPMPLALPKNTSRKKPTTVGGSTRGRVKTASQIPAPWRIHATFHAANIPIKKVMTVAMPAALNDNVNGDQSMLFPLRCCIYYLLV